VALPALACILLMAVTNQLCQSVAVVPLLWIAPLSLYLLSFIICFDREAWYNRVAFSLAAVLAVLAVSYLGMATHLNPYFDEQGMGLQWRYWTGHVGIQSGTYLTVLFLLCMLCHGELVRRKPAPQWLTHFYLSVSAGGALGGVTVALICPRMFTTFFELNLALLAGFLVALIVFVLEVQKSRWVAQVNVVLRFAVGAVLLAMLAVVAIAQMYVRDREQVLVRVRNFYGIVSIRDRPADDERYGGRAMFHGDTVHGFQLNAAGEEQTPTSYYTRLSGVGWTLQHLRPDAPIRVGAIGLGAGTIASYGREDDVYRFYEIDPLVIELAQRWFSFLDESDADIEYEPGDARLSLEQELATPQNFDVLVLDAFSGDAIPVHLLTDEAFSVYDQHLKPGGVIAVHISNRYLDLEPVVARVAREHEYHGIVAVRTEEVFLAYAPSVWVLLSKDPEFAKGSPCTSDADGQGGVRPLVADPQTPLWTDQYNNLFQVLRKAREPGVRS
jgi:spermidine synthase